MPRTKKKASSNKKTSKMEVVKTAPVKMVKGVKKAPQKLKRVATKKGAAQSVAKGAAGVALAATAVAAGAALTSKTYRKKILVGAEQVFETLKDTANDTYDKGQHGMQAVTHTVGKRTNRSNTRNKRSKK